MRGRERKKERREKERGKRREVRRRTGAEIPLYSPHAFSCRLQGCCEELEAPGGVAGARIWASSLLCYGSLLLLQLSRRGPAGSLLILCTSVSLPSKVVSLEDPGYFAFSDCLFSCCFACPGPTLVFNCSVVYRFVSSPIPCRLLRLPAETNTRRALLYR